MRLFVIRHAQSANNALPEELRIEDPPITELGHRQAAAVAQWLSDTRIDHLIASPFRRSLETAEHIRRKIDAQPHVWVDLHEQGGCYAGYERERYQGRPGMSQQQIAAEFPGYAIDPSICEKGWWKCQPYESDEQAGVRARRLVGRTLEEFGSANDNVAYVMHADFKRLFLNAIFETVQPPPVAWASIYNTAVTIVEFRDRQGQLEVYNSIAHLTPDLVSK